MKLGIVLQYHDKEKKKTIEKLHVKGYQWNKGTNQLRIIVIIEEDKNYIRGLNWHVIALRNFNGSDIVELLCTIDNFLVVTL